MGEFLLVSAGQAINHLSRRSFRAKTDQPFLTMRTTRTITECGSCLIYRNTFGRITVMPLDQPVIVGSSHEALLRIRDSTISRFHCAIYSTLDLNIDPKQSWYICDLNSQNGTYLNGKRIHRSARLLVGDCIRLGRTHSIEVK